MLYSYSVVFIARLCYSVQLTEVVPEDVVDTEVDTTVDNDVENYDNYDIMPKCSTMLLGDR